MHRCPRSWWRHQMETFSALLAICTGNSPVTCEFPAQRPVTRSFDVLFDLSLNKRLNKQSWGWWFETPLTPLWRHCNVLSDKLGECHVSWMKGVVETLMSNNQRSFLSLILNCWALWTTFSLDPQYNYAANNGESMRIYLYLPFSDCAENLIHTSGPTDVDRHTMVVVLYSYHQTGTIHKRNAFVKEQITCN